MISYARLRLKRAVSDTVSFWNIHRTWTQFVLPFIGLLSIILAYVFHRMGFTLLSNMTTSAALFAVLWAALVWIVGWMGSFLINYIFLSPKALYEESTSEAQGRRAESH